MEGGILSRYRSFLAVFVLVALTIQPTAVFATPSLQENRSQAKKIETEIETVEAELEVAVERYNQAYLRLGDIQRELAETTEKLAQAQADLRTRKTLLDQRVAGIYKSGQTIGWLDILLSSKSVGELLRTVNSVQVVSGHDALLVKQVKHDRQEIRRAKQTITARQKSHESVLRTLASGRNEIGDGLKQRQRALAKVKSDIGRQDEAEARIAQARAPQLLAPVQLNVGPPPLSVQPSVSPPPKPSPAPPRAPAGDKAALIVSLARAQLGKPYVWAAAGPNAFDCSGLTMYVFAQAGISLPHSAEAQYNMGTRVSKDQLQPGDLVFGAYGGYISHVGIYIGGGQYIHAPQTGESVRIKPVSSRRNYIGAVRLL